MGLLYLLHVLVATSILILLLRYSKQVINHATGQFISSESCGFLFFQNVICNEEQAGHLLFPSPYQSISVRHFFSTLVLWVSHSVEILQDRAGCMDCIINTRRVACRTCQQKTQVYVFSVRVDILTYWLFALFHKSNVITTLKNEI